ncbi:MAG: DUF5067 domain-containing protein [Clostridium sp.]|nr:DUF5067 domain-containing protein [Clostridium sp.]
MKKMLALIVSLVFILAIVGCSDDKAESPKDTGSALVDTEKEDDPEKKEEAVPESGSAIGTYTIGEDIVTMNSVELGKDWDGEDCIVIDYTWTNNSDETTSWILFSSEQVFQDGQELDGTGLENDPNLDMKDIRPGNTIEGIKSAYKPISEGPIEIELSSWDDFWDDNDPILVEVEYPK